MNPPPFKIDRFMQQDPYLGSILGKKKTQGDAADAVALGRDRSFFTGERKSS